MGKNMSAHEPNNEGQNPPSKYYIGAPERKVSLGNGMVRYTWTSQGKFTMSRHGDHIQWLSFSAAVGYAIWREL